MILTYDLLRGVADGLLVKARETPQIRVEAFLFGRPVPTVRLQEHLWHGPNDLRWWDYATWFLHLTHFFVTFIAAAAIWVFARDKFTAVRADDLRARADRASRPTRSSRRCRRGWRRSTATSASRTG